MGREKKKLKQVSTAPMGKRKRKKKLKQVSEAPLGMGKKRNAGIRGPDGPRNTAFFGKKKNRYPWPRWAKEKKKRIKAGIHNPDGQV